MITATELFGPLAVCASFSQSQRRIELMEGVLRQMSGSPGTPPTSDPAWTHLSRLLPSKRPRTPAPAPNPLILSLTLSTDGTLIGQTILVRFPLGGVDTAIIGVLADHQPLTLHVTRNGYLDHDRPVPDFLRAYDGMRTMDVSAPEARHMLHLYPAPELLAAVICSYRAGLRGRGALASLHQQFTGRAASGHRSA